MPILKRTGIVTTEPYTNPDGSWVRATFRYRTSLRFDHHDLVNSGWPEDQLFHKTVRYLKDEALAWRTGFPTLQLDAGFPRVDRSESPSDNVLWLSFIMAGSFALSSNLAKTRRILELIDKPVESVELLSWGTFVDNVLRV